MAPPPQQPPGQKVFFHLEIIEIKILGVGLMIGGGVNPQLAKELMELMAKYKLKRIDAVLVPCNRQETEKQTIHVEVSKDTTAKNCSKCGTAVSGPFCAECGEKIQ